MSMGVLWGGLFKPLRIGLSVSTTTSHAGGGEGCRLQHLQKWLRLFILHRDPEYLMMIMGLAKEVIDTRKAFKR